MSPLMRTLEQARKGRRDDYPIHPVWNSVMAGIVFEHKSIERLCRELRCNGGCHTEHGRIVRVPIDTDRRIFIPQARDSKTWAREYKHRTVKESFLPPTEFRYPYMEEGE